MNLASLSAAINCRNLKATSRTYEGKGWNLICARDGKSTDQAHCGLCRMRERLVR